MNRNLKLLMTETSPELCRLCKEEFAAHNIDVVICPRNGVAAYSELVQHMPDVVLLDVFMPGMDAISLKRKFDEAHPDAGTVFFVTGTFQNEDIEKEVMEGGFSFYFLKPFDHNTLASRIHQSVGKSMKLQEVDAVQEEDMVTDMLRMIGVPAHIKGYRFLRDAILMVVDDPALMNAVTKVLYPEIATNHDTISSRVERAIRHAIEVAWDRGDIETLTYYFGSTVHSMRGKPTNSEFIAMLADRVVLAKKRKG